MVGWGAVVKQLHSKREFERFERELAVEVQSGALVICEWTGNRASYPWSLWPFARLILMDSSGVKWCYDKPSEMDWGRFYKIDL